MNAIEAVKLAGQIAVKTIAGASQTKLATSVDAGAFSKLLSSINNEESVEQEQILAEVFTDIEAAIAELEQLPPEELQPEQQELLAALAQLLSLYQIQDDKNIVVEHSSFEKRVPLGTLHSASLLKNPVADDPRNEKMVVLLHQIVHKAQELGQGTAKEFAEIPIFTGVEKAYILNKPNKASEIINLLADAAENLETMDIQERPAFSAKLADKIQDLLQMVAGTLEKAAIQSEQQKYEEPSFLQKAIMQKALDASISEEDRTVPPAKPIDPAPAIAAISPETVKAAAAPAKPELSAPVVPVVRMAYLADDLGAIFGSAVKLSGTGETVQLKVSIFPEHLGQLEIRLNSVDGKVAAQIVTSSPMAKEALELQVYHLRNSLSQQGIQLDRIEISSQQQSGQLLSQQQSQQEQRFARQPRNIPSSTNGYEQKDEETSSFVRGISSDGAVMAVDYTI